MAWFASRLEIEIDHTPVETRGAFVTGAFYQVLGIKPALGRLIEPGDDTAGGSSVAVLGYSFWERNFEGHPAVGGRVLRIPGAPLTIIGVTPAEFADSAVYSPRAVTIPP